MKLRDTWGNRHVWPWSANEAGQRLTELCQENALLIANTLFQHHQMVNTKIGLIIFFAAEDEEADCMSAKTRPGADCEKFRLKLKKVGKATRPFRYDLNQIPYDYTVEVRNRFEG